MDVWESPVWFCSSVIIDGVSGLPSGDPWLVVYQDVSIAYCCSSCSVYTRRHGEAIESDCENPVEEFGSSNGLVGVGLAGESTSAEDALVLSAL